LKACARGIFPKERSVVEKLAERSKILPPLHFEDESKKISDNSSKNFLLESQIKQGHFEENIVNPPVLGPIAVHNTDTLHRNIPPKRVNLVAWQDLRDEPVRYLVDGLIPARSFGAIYGKPGSYKSFVALYLAAMVATGREAFGKATTPGAVIYIAGEGGAGLKRRRDALMRHYDLPADAPVYFIRAQLNLATTLDDRDALLAEVRALNISPSLVIIDTFARAFVGEENSAKDVGAAIAVMGSIEQETGAAVLIVHHSGKAESAGMRGSSALLGAVDCELHCEKIGDDKTARLSLTKSKDSEDGITFPFKCELVRLSEIDETNASLVVVPCEESDLPSRKSGKRAKISDDAKKMLRALEMGIAEAGAVAPLGLDRAPKGTKAISVGLWREYWRTMTDKKGGTERAAWSRGYQQLEDAGLFGFWADYCWIIKEEPETVRPPAPGFYSEDIPFP
jgi:hypothetical protein